MGSRTVNGEQAAGGSMDLAAPIASASRELAPSGIAAAAVQEIQAAVILSRKFPRNEDLAYQKIMRALKRYQMADDAIYEYRRGGSTIKGPSIYLMQEMARCWGNIRYGFVVIAEDGDCVTTRAYAWDMETNVARSQDCNINKLIQRKTESGETRWIVPDERDLRELVSNITQRAVRKCIEQLLPSDFIADAMAQADVTLAKKNAEDPDLMRKQIILGFDALNITTTMLEEFLGHSLAQASPAEMQQLRGMWKSIASGENTWQDYAGQPGEAAAAKGKNDEAASKARRQAEELKEKLRQKKAKPAPAAAASTADIAETVLPLKCPKCGGAPPQVEISTKDQDGGKRHECGNCGAVWVGPVTPVVAAEPVSQEASAAAQDEPGANG